MATDKQYADAADAVSKGTASAEQLRLNNRMSGIARAGNTNVQRAQDAQMTPAAQKAAKKS